MKFSYSGVWDETVSMVRGNLSLLVAIGGAFIFLPNLLLGYFAPDPQPSGTDMQVIIDAWESYWRENWYWMLLVFIANIVGALAILILIFDARRPTVATAIAGSARLLIPYFGVSIVSGFILLGSFSIIGVPIFYAFGKSMPLIVGLIALVPTAYVYSRLVPLAPIVVAEDRLNPFAVIKRSFQITAGYGWTILGIVLLVAVSALILIIVLIGVLGSLFVLLANQEIATFLVLILRTALEALLTIVMTLLAAAIYRRIAVEA